MELKYLHPIFIHFPIAFYVLECFLLGLYFFKKDGHYRRFALFVFRLAYLFGIAAMLTGLKDAGGLSKLKGDLLTHALFAAGLFLWNTLRAVYWHKAKPETPNYALFLLLGAVISVAITFLTGLEGGELVYE